MNCIICSSKMNFYFLKDFKQSSEFDKRFDLGKVEYFKCINCGFVMSKTHAEMEKKVWEKLNNDFHTFIENPNNKKNNNQPPYVHIALLLNILLKNNIIEEKILDFGAGFGTLHKILLKYQGIKILVFDEYVNDLNSDIQYLTRDTISSSTFNTVITSAVLEHITERNHIENINKLVKNSGALAIHTLICENVPNDPSWFYLLPVHTAFFTNKSMKILMEYWNYSCSLYSLDAKTWVLFKEKQDIERKVREINQEIQSDYLVYKNEFVDFWKTF